MTLKARLASLVLIAFTVLSATASHAQSPRPGQPAAPQLTEPEPQPSVLGLWRMTSDEGKPILWCLFVKQDGIYKGIVAKTFPRPLDKPNPVCAKCADDRHDQPVLGIELIRGMQRRGLKYQNGNILDPRNGDIYHALMTLSPDGQTLTVRGYLGIPMLGMDQVWQRLPDDDAANLDTTVLKKYLPDQSPQQMKMKREPQQARQAPRPKLTQQAQQARQAPRPKLTQQALRPASLQNQNRMELVAVPRPRPRRTPVVQHYNAQPSPVDDDKRRALPALH